MRGFGSTDVSALAKAFFEGNLPSSFLPVQSFQPSYLPAGQLSTLPQWEYVTPDFAQRVASLLPGSSVIQAPPWGGWEGTGIPAANWVQTPDGPFMPGNLDPPGVILNYGDECAVEQAFASMIPGGTLSPTCAAGGTGLTPAQMAIQNSGMSPTRSGDSFSIGAWRKPGDYFDPRSPSGGSPDWNDHSRSGDSAGECVQSSVIGVQHSGTVNSSRVIAGSHEYAGIKHGRGKSDSSGDSRGEYGLVFSSHRIKFRRRSELGMVGGCGSGDVRLRGQTLMLPNSPFANNSGVDYSASYDANGTPMPIDSVVIGGYLQLYADPALNWVTVQYALDNSGNYLPVPSNLYTQSGSVFTIHVLPPLAIAGHNLSIRLFAETGDSWSDNWPIDPPGAGVFSGGGNAEGIVSDTGVFMPSQALQSWISAGMPQATEAQALASVGGSPQASSTPPPASQVVMGTPGASTGGAIAATPLATSTLSAPGGAMVSYIPTSTPGASIGAPVASTSATSFLTD